MFALLFLLLIVVILPLGFLYLMSHSPTSFILGLILLFLIWYNWILPKIIFH